MLLRTLLFAAFVTSLDVLVIAVVVVVRVDGHFYRPQPQPPYLLPQPPPSLPHPRLKPPPKNGMKNGSASGLAPASGAASASGAAMANAAKAMSNKIGIHLFIFANLENFKDLLSLIFTLMIDILSS